MRIDTMRGSLTALRGLWICCAPRSLGTLRGPGGGPRQRRVSSTQRTNQNRPALGFSAGVKRQGGTAVALAGRCFFGLGVQSGWRRAAPALVSAVLIVLLPACSDSGEDAGAPAPTTGVSAAGSTTPTTSPTVTTTIDPAADIAARYRQFWEVRYEANRNPVNPTDPRFAQLATGKQLDNVVTETRQRRDQGLAIRRPDPTISRNRVKVLEVSNDTARLQDCSTNDGIVYRVATGQVLDECHCRGLRVGDAMVYEKHANIIVNDGRASAAEVLELANEMKRRAREKFGVELEEEVMFLGARPKLTGFPAETR